MRLWHKWLIPYLPRQQLIAQWRECCCIARNIAVNGSPNHILVNRIMDYPISHFQTYSKMIFMECISRGYSMSPYNFTKWIHEDFEVVPIDDCFKDWHDLRYFWQCYYNLEEKFDCGGIPLNEWEVLCDEFAEYTYP